MIGWVQDWSLSVGMGCELLHRGHGGDTEGHREFVGNPKELAFILKMIIL